MRKAGEPGNEDGERAYIVARFYLGSRRGMVQMHSLEMGIGCLALRTSLYER